jgi:pimeloyl-ACP methyl ester carboxylesterase
MSGLIAGSELQVIEDCGHFATLEKPDEVSALMLRWLDL